MEPFTASGQGPWLYTDPNLLRLRREPPEVGDRLRAATRGNGHLLNTQLRCFRLFSSLLRWVPSPAPSPLPGTITVSHLTAEQR